MADFDLIQTDAQVQSILNDGQNMQGAGAQTTLTTESVLLKDVNGNYHKILKSSFTEAIRDTLAGLLVNNDKGTTINQIAAIASGDFGSITPANLASVLGVGFTKVSTLEDYDTAIKSDCISFYAGGPIAIPNSPFGDSQVWQGCITIMYNDQRGMQIAMNGQTGDIKKRCGLPQSSAGGTTWGAWTDL